MHAKILSELLKAISLGKFLISISMQKRNFIDYLITVYFFLLNDRKLKNGEGWMWFNKSHVDDFVT